MGVGSRTGGDVDRGRQRQVRAYATLVRLPNLFTAPPDVILGAAITVALGHTVQLQGLAGLGFASMLAYAGGTTLNDYVDAADDARFRPERPIPSGAIPRRHALAIGLASLIGAVKVAGIAAGRPAVAVASGLVLLILLYDGLAKDGPAGFLVMGGVRGTNVLLGTTLALPLTELPNWALSIPVAIALFIAGVTCLAEFETEGGPGRGLTVAVSTWGLALAWAAVILWWRSASLAALVLGGVLLAAFVGWTGSAFWATHADPSSALIGRTIGRCVLGLALLNGAFAAVGGVWWAFGAVLFLLPALGLSRVFEVT